MKKVQKHFEDKPNLEGIETEELIPYPTPVIHDPKGRIISYDDFRLDETRIKLIFKKEKHIKRKI